MARRQGQDDDAGVADDPALDLLAGLEGLAFALGDLPERLVVPASREVLLDCARAIERVPELLGLSPHLLVVARVPRGRGQA